MSEPKGAELLDRKVVRWWRHIDVDTLDVSDVKNCPFGQIFGSYETGVSQLDVARRHDSLELGITLSVQTLRFIATVPAPVRKLIADFAYKQLTERWIRAVERRHTGCKTLMHARWRKICKANSSSTVNILTGIASSTSTGSTCVADDAASLANSTAAMSSV